MSSFCNGSVFLKYVIDTITNLVYSTEDSVVEMNYSKMIILNLTATMKDIFLAYPGGGHIA